MPTQADFDILLDDLLTDFTTSTSQPQHQPQPQPIQDFPSKNSIRSSLRVIKPDKTAGLRAKRYRERRKKALAEALKENKRLKVERATLAEKLQALQSEMQTIGGNYLMNTDLDLGSDNYALRSELEVGEKIIWNVVTVWKEMFVWGFGGEG